MLFTGPAVAVLTGILFGAGAGVAVFQGRPCGDAEGSHQGGRAPARAEDARRKSFLVVVEGGPLGGAAGRRGIDGTGIFVALQQTPLGFPGRTRVSYGERAIAAESANTTWEQRVAFTQNLMERGGPQFRERNRRRWGMVACRFRGMQSRYSIDGLAGPDSQAMMLGLISGDYGRTFGDSTGQRARIYGAGRGARRPPSR